MPKKIELYTIAVCPYCDQVKAMFKRYGVTDFEEVRIDKMENGREILMQKTGGYRSVPQIFVDGVHIGDEEKLMALHESGELEKVLK